MFCPKCGKELLEGSLFCPDCGNKLKTVEQGSPKQNAPNVPNTHSSDKPRLAQEDGVCPQCGSRDCEIHVVGSATNYSGVWVCKKCGDQFPTRKNTVSGLTLSLAIFCSILTCFILLTFFSLIGSMWPIAFVFAAMAAGIFNLIRYVIKKGLGEGPLHQVLTNGLLTEQEYSTLKKSCIWTSVVVAVLALPFILAMLGM